MRAAVKGFSASVIVTLLASITASAQLGSFTFDRLDSTRILVHSDTLNQYDLNGNRSGMWIHWSSDEVAFDHILEHLESSSGQVAHSHRYDTLATQTVWFPKVQSMGMYREGHRVGQWLGFSSEGRLAWLLSFDSSGGFSLLSMFKNNGQLWLSGTPSTQSTETIHLRWYDDDGKLLRTEEAPRSFLP